MEHVNPNGKGPQQMYYMPSIERNDALLGSAIHGKALINARELAILFIEHTKCKRDFGWMARVLHRC